MHTLEVKVPKCVSITYKTLLTILGTRQQKRFQVSLLSFPEACMTKPALIKFLLPVALGHDRLLHLVQ